MKKLLCCLAVCLLLPVGVLAEAAPLTAEDFAFVLEDVAYFPGQEAAPLIDAVAAWLGAPLDVTEAESCMFSGMDREYACDSLIIGTYPIGPGGADALESFLILDDSLATPRGVRVGMAREDVAACYGEDFLLDYDTMIYALGEEGPMLLFTLDLATGKVVSWSLIGNAAS